MSTATIRIMGKRSQVAKLLMLQDQGRIGEFQNQSLEEIQFEDVVQEDTEDTEVTDSDQGQVHTEEDSHLEEALDESQTFFSQFEGNSNSELEGQSKKSKAAETRKTWSADEQEEIKALFKKCFDLKKRPTPKYCLKAQRKSKRENGFIHERKKDVLKKKVFRMIDKLKGNSNSELEGQSKKSKAAETRKTWSADEQEEIKALFKKFFDLKKRPTPKDCLKAQRKSKRENGFIHERKKDVLKKKVFRMIDKLSD